MAPRKKAPKKKVASTGAADDTGIASNDEVVTYTTQSAPLLLLPKEMLIKIFRVVLNDTKMDYQRRTGVKRKAEARHKDSTINPNRCGFFDGKPEPPGYMLACKQLYYESLKPFYNNAIFEFETLFTMRSWLQAVSSENLALVKSTHLILDGKPIVLEEGQGGQLVTEKKKRPTSAFKNYSWYRSRGRTDFVYDDSCKKCGFGDCYHS